jgi:hypothetical protein
VTQAIIDLRHCIVLILLRLVLAIAPEDEAGNALVKALHDWSCGELR